MLLSFARQLPQALKAKTPRAATKAVQQRLLCWQIRSLADITPACVQPNRKTLAQTFKLLLCRQREAISRGRRHVHAPNTCECPSAGSPDQTV